LTLGAEVAGGVDDNNGLGKDQLQGLAGGQYELHKGFSVTFAALGGSHVGSPRIGGQVGFEVDFPAVRNIFRGQRDLKKVNPNFINGDRHVM
jgi:hypothetical protein